MADNAKLESQLEALSEAIATGELTVRHGDRLVTYRTIDELIKAKMMLLREVRSGPRFRTARFNESY